MSVFEMCIRERHYSNAHKWNHSDPLSVFITLVASHRFVIILCGGPLYTRNIRYSISSCHAAHIKELSILAHILCTQYIMALKWTAHEPLFAYDSLKPHCCKVIWPFSSPILKIFEYFIHAVCIIHQKLLSVRVSSSFLAWCFLGTKERMYGKFTVKFWSLLTVPFFMKLYVLWKFV